MILLRFSEAEQNGRNRLQAVHDVFAGLGARKDHLSVYENKQDDTRLYHAVDESGNISGS